MINLLIAGYHGFGNCGDEATLLAMTSNIKKLTGEVNITALSFKPEVTESEYGINAVQRFNVYQVLKAVAGCDILISGGGTLLQDGTSTRSLVYYLSIIKLAKILGKKVMLYSNGIGPVTKKFNRKLIKSVINTVDLITLREKSSEDDLREIGVNKPDIFVTADPAFTLKPVSNEAAIQLLKDEGIDIEDGRQLVGVSIREWTSSVENPDKYVKTIADVCDRLFEAGKRIVLIPMQYPRDLEVSAKLKEAMKHECHLLSKPYTPPEILGLIGQMELMFSMRLHTLIFAAVMRVPMIGIVYDPKVLYYLKLLNMPCAGDIRTESLDAEKIIAQIGEIFENHSAYVDILDKGVSDLVRKAYENDEYLKKLL